MHLIFPAVLISFFILYACLILYYRKAWLSIPTFSKTHLPETTITVIVPARNEALKIGRLLNSLKAQSYPADLFEVIIVDDHSTDDTHKIASGFGGNVKAIRLSDHITDPINSYKKKAIEVAIASSQSELIVTTDADCIVPSNWLSTINSFYLEKAPEMIVMPVALRKIKKPLPIFQLLDFMVLQGITGAAIQRKFHGMCNGANLAYKRSAFYEANGFEGIDSIASGDDMLLLDKINRKSPSGIAYLRSPQVIVQTDPMETVQDFINQRIRWASKAGSYMNRKIPAIMILVYFFNVSLLLFPFLAIVAKPIRIGTFTISLFTCWLVVLIGKTIIELLFLYPVARFFKQRSILKYFPLAQPFHIVYTVLSGTLGLVGNYSWKGRKVK